MICIHWRSYKAQGMTGEKESLITLLLALQTGSLVWCLVDASKRGTNAIRNDIM